MPLKLFNYATLVLILNLTLYFLKEYNFISVAFEMAGVALVSKGGEFTILHYCFKFLNLQPILIPQSLCNPSLDPLP